MKKKKEEEFLARARQQQGNRDHRGVRHQHRCLQPRIEEAERRRLAQRDVGGQRRRHDQRDRYGGSLGGLLDERHRTGRQYQDITDDQEGLFPIYRLGLVAHVICRSNTRTS